MAAPQHLTKISPGVTLPDVSAYAGEAETEVPPFLLAGLFR